MSLYMTIFMVISLGILVFASGYTWRLAKNQKDIKGDLDSEIPGQVQRHAYIRNPVFLAYLIFFLLMILTVVFAALTINW